MRHRLTSAILLLYPCRVRKRHGPEIVALIDDLFEHEGSSRSRLFIRLAVDGLLQRIVSTATAWTVAAVLAATSVGGLAVSNFAAAHAFKALPRTVHTGSAKRHPHQGPQHLPRSHRRAAGLIAAGDRLRHRSGLVAAIRSATHRSLGATARNSSLICGPMGTATWSPAAFCVIDLAAPAGP